MYISRRAESTLSACGDVAQFVTSLACGPLLGRS